MTSNGDDPGPDRAGGRVLTRLVDGRSGSVGLPVLVIAVCAVFALVNVAGSPDIISDEPTYALVGKAVFNYDALTFGASPIVVHPPLFFLVAGGWLGLTGRNDASVTSALTSLRYLNGLFDLGIVVVCGLLARAWLRREVSARPVWIMPLAMLLVGTDGFLLRFGRAVLIDPMAVLFSVLALLVSWWLRNARLPVYAAGTGLAIGVALLVKEPALFVVIVPLVAALLRWNVRAVGRELLAFVTGLFLFCAFPLWAYQTGNRRSFDDTQTLSVRRLLGLSQVTGLNRQSEAAGGGALTSVKETFAQFAGAYLLFLAGGIALLILLWQLVRSRRGGDQFGDGKHQMLALGIVSYAFLAYSFTVGQANEQLTVYSVPAAAILTTWLALCTGRGTRLSHVVRTGARVGVGIGAVGLVASLVAAVAFYPVRDDNATVRVENYIHAHVGPCVPVNSSGKATHWSYTLRTNPITAFDDGSQALSAGTHLFLLSPRDAEFRYGNSSPELDAWIRAHGTRLFEAGTNVYGSVSLWRVGVVPRPPTTNPAQCVPKLQTPVASTPAPALRFVLFLGCGVAVVALVLAGCLVIDRRRSHRPSSPAAS